jgi:hypothetical protein
MIDAGKAKDVKIIHKVDVVGTMVKELNLRALNLGEDRTYSGQYN